MNNEDLILKIADEKNLRLAFEKIKKKNKGKGLDNQSVKDIEKNLDQVINKMSKQLLNLSYHPGVAKKVLISKKDKRNKRAIFIMNNKDKIIQNAILLKIDPIFDMKFSNKSFAFRHHKSYLDALDLVIKYLNRGYIYILKIDIQSFFDTIPHEKLLEILNKDIKNKETMIIIKRYLKQKTFYRGKFKINKLGILQGSAISPLFANTYLNNLDLLLEKEKGIKFVRYADDLVILSCEKKSLEKTLNLVMKWIRNYKLKINLEKSSVIKIYKKAEFDFLGYHFKNKRVMKI